MWIKDIQACNSSIIFRKIACTIACTLFPVVSEYDHITPHIVGYTSYCLNKRNKKKDLPEYSMQLFIFSFVENFKNFFAL